MKTPPVAGRLQHIFVVLLLTVLLGSCKKDSSPLIEASKDETTNKVIAWLEKQKTQASAEGAAKIESLKESLDFSLLTVVPFPPGEVVLVIPVKNSFVTTSNADKNPANSLVLFLNKNHEIRRCNIVQYISSQRISSRRALADFFNSYYRFRITDFTGSLVYLTFTDEIAYELNYIKGDVNYYKSMEKKQLGNLAETCYEIGWYYYWSDGSVTWEPIGGYCDDCVPARTVNGQTYRVNCGGGGGGGGGNNEEPPALTKEMDWEVYSENMYGPPAKITAKVQFWGRKVSGELQGGHFTQATDHNTYTENFNTYGMDWVTVYSQSWHGTQFGYQTVQGNITYAPYTLPPKYINKPKTFMFAEVFP